MYGLFTFVYFTVVALGLTASFVFLTLSLRQFSLGNSIFKKTKRQYDFVFGIIMVCFLVWSGFHIMLKCNVFSGNGARQIPLYSIYFVQDIFYFIWDMPPILPVLWLHHI